MKKTYIFRVIIFLSNIIAISVLTSLLVFLGNCAINELPAGMMERDVAGRGVHVFLLNSYFWKLFYPSILPCLFQYPIELLNLRAMATMLPLIFGSWLIIRKIWQDCICLCAILFQAIAVLPYGIGLVFLYNNCDIGKCGVWWLFQIDGMLYCFITSAIVCIWGHPFRHPRPTLPLTASGEVPPVHLQ